MDINLSDDFPNGFADALAGIYAITDDTLLPGSRLIESVQAALDGGINLLQYRSKNPDFSRRVELASQLKQACDAYNVPLVINDDIDLTLSIGAAGVHLGQSDASVRQARHRLGHKAIVGVTCHASIEVAHIAETDGASYVAFGRFFRSHTKPNAPATDLDILTKARQQITIPTVAIGGINAENGAAVLAAGADMLAVINYLFAGDDVRQQVIKLRELFG